MHHEVTPESILSIPEFEGPWPDPSGVEILYIERRFSPSTHLTNVKLILLNTVLNEGEVLYESPSIQTALRFDGGSSIALFENLPSGAVKMSVMGPKAVFTFVAELPQGSTALAGLMIDKNHALVAFSGISAGTPEAQHDHVRTRPHSSGREYLKAPVRGLSSWMTAEKPTLYIAVLDLSGDAPCLGPLFDTLQLSDQEYDSYGGIDLTEAGLALVTTPRFPQRSERALTMVSYIPMSGLLRRDHSKRLQLRVPGFDGSASSPRICADGNSMVFLQKRYHRYEEEASLVVFVRGLDVEREISTTEILHARETQILLQPRHLTVSHDAATVYFLADDRGESKVFRASLTGRDSITAEPLTSDWSVESFHILQESKTMFLTGSMLHLPRRWAKLELSNLALTEIRSGTLESDAQKFDDIEYESIQWPGADGISVQAWLVKPRDFDASKRYPLLYCIKGGPNSAWNNAWPSTYFRNWNPMLFAERGYVSIFPNQSGSTGFGHSFAQRSKSQWVGNPFVDVEKGFEWITKNLHFVDINRAVAIGQSAGGFLVNWMNGLPLGRRFRAIVSECSMINTTSIYTRNSDYIETAFGGRPLYEDSSFYEAHNPLSRISKWQTPTLFIASELDYAAPMLESLAGFHVLQARGIESRLLTFPDEGHIIEQPSNRLHFLEVLLEWCHRHTRLDSEDDKRAIVGL